MRIITQNNKRRVVFAWIETLTIDGEEVNEYMLSPFEATRSNRRPIARFDSAQDLERVANTKGCIVSWL